MTYDVRKSIEESKLLFVLNTVLTRNIETLFIFSPLPISIITVSKTLLIHR